MHSPHHRTKPAATTPSTPTTPQSGASSPLVGSGGGGGSAGGGKGHRGPAATPPKDNDPLGSAASVPPTPSKLTPLRAQLSPAFRARYIAYEFQRVCDAPVPSVYILPSAHDVSVWYGVVFVDAGPYEGGVFHFKLAIPQDYPNAAPLLGFDNLYHPKLASLTGEKPDKLVSVEKVFVKVKDWKRSRHSMRTVVRLIPALFKAKSLELFFSRVNDRTRKVVKERIAWSVKDSQGSLPRAAHGYSSFCFSPVHADHHKQLEKSWKAVARGSYEDAMAMKGDELMALFQNAVAKTVPDFLGNDYKRGRMRSESSGSLGAFAGLAEPDAAQPSNRSKVLGGL